MLAILLESTFQLQTQLPPLHLEPLLPAPQPPLVSALELLQQHLLQLLEPLLLPLAAASALEHQQHQVQQRYDSKSPMRRPESGRQPIAAQDGGQGYGGAAAADSMER